MPQRFCALPALLLVWALTGCSTKAPSSPLTEEQYLRDLRIDPAIVDGRLVVTTRTAHAPVNLREVHRVSLVTDDGERPFGETSGLLGVAVTNSMELDDLGGKLDLLKEVRVHYEVWDGEPGAGTKLFGGQKEVPIVKPDHNEL